MELGTFKFKEVDPLVRLRGSVVSGLALPCPLSAFAHDLNFWYAYRPEG
jgi:hypothetical protein